MRKTVVDSGGEIVSSSSPSGPEVVDAKRSAAAAKLKAGTHDTPELRKFCLELAARGATEASDIVTAAKEFRDFVLKG